ncbi:DoxX-like family protein [Actinopolymorpha cephalotaxi]|uniref:DoxX-like family protein n=1 Tax=Actinopolymorpha cephalotaxi TaxID=504797 RepID=A0A1I2Q926_9ACTN|nr:DoxX family protein [Actinopolymorpha cephalotaxi]NYH83394.1 putative membrane protein YphA (DoxX/SURF4 family) [Actinopolymorpha cephalotaxi]SFG22121.1 DoxX-like family protein [Actinopolymorpha cephalotaxi]
MSESVSRRGTNSTDTASPAAAGRAANIGLWVAQAVTALTFLVAALGKFGGDPMVVATFDRIGFGDWFRYLIGVLEILGAIALFVPRLAGLAGLAFVALMVGAVVVTLAVAGGNVVLPLALLILSAVIAWGRWRSTTSLWNALTRR